MDNLSKGFEGLRAKGKAFKGCVGALDGILIPMQSPGQSVPNPGSYYSSRKGYFAILVNLHPQTLKPKTCIRNPQPLALNPHLSTLNTKF